MNDFMVGRIAVRSIIVDGPAGTAAKFTDAEILRLRTETVEGLGVLRALAAVNVPKIPIVFSLRSAVVPVTVVPAFTPMLGQPAASDYEEREAPWRDAALSQLVGDVGGAGLLKLREQSLGGADHGLVVLWTKYECAWQAYSRASEAKVVMCWSWLGDTSRQGWGAANVDRVFAHECGHIFGAPDEYAGCAVLSATGAGFGKLDFPNFNCVDVNSSSVACLMRTNDAVACPHSRVHFGWSDSNGDGVLDVFQ